MERFGNLSLIPFEGGLRLEGDPHDLEAATAYILSQIPEDGLLELFVRDPALQSAVAETFATRIYVRTAQRRFELDPGRFSPQYRLASAYTLREEAASVAVWRENQRLSHCEWDDAGAMTFATVPSYQEMGLATVCGRVAVAKLLDLGVTPNMTCRRHQFPAAALAARLGFVPVWEEQIYGLRREEVLPDGTAE